MDERNPSAERRALASSTTNCVVQCPCRIPIIWSCTAPKQMCVHVLCYFGRKVIADRPHRPNDASVSCKQHACCDMDSLFGEALVSLGRLTRGQKGESTTGTLQCGHVPQLQTASIGETKSTIDVILDSVACEMDPVSLFHQRKYFLNRAFGRFYEGSLC